ncbi:hypothetical protein FIV42_21375 [Persicimonas caeni]|uniref:Protein kinase domain-containing protein n=2 Tax=Persicimonas caeni TaxID=2292766 RepID=A0A4Y6PY75_PERCE|nr:hypothetical protein FIV42_21375 [Persicimonas caeni]QED34425.1 hypothetical protein FRD00_21370 [Persicimonas caeni]
MVDLHGLQQGAGRVEESTEPHREALSVGSSPSPAPSHGGNQQVFAPGGGGGYEGKTDFININDFAQQNAEFAPDSSSAGYEGKTAFIQIDDLQGSQQQQASGPQGPTNIANDQMLRQSYQFGPQSIQQGEVTLIFAQNPLGRPVVLRQVWAGDPSQMPPDIRQRIAQLDALEHPSLVKLNGVFATQSGLWADLQKPEGYRLSAVLQQHGPQDKENVIDWMKQVAEVLDLIHDAELLYGNLTPDAIWIQEDNSIVLEPFDLLSFEKRGDLGPYGAQELKRPPQDRQMSPATDVFSLAAVGAAALTGLPFHAEKLSNYDDQKLAKKLEAALSANPAERPQRASELTDALKAGGGVSLDGLSLNPAELDIKIVAAIAVLLLGGFAGYMYWNKQQAQKARQAQARQAAIAKKQQEAAQPAGGSPAAGSEAGNAGAGSEAGAPAAAGAVAPPGAVQSDPRLTIVSSYRTNPPADGGDKKMSDEEAAAEAKKLRAEAQKHLKDAKNSGSLEEYKAALTKLTSAVRLSGGKPNDEDQKMLEELTSEKEVRQFRDDLRKDIDKALAEGAVGEARLKYKRLHSVDYRADAIGFFHRATSAEVRTVHEPAEKADEDED